MGPLRLGGSGDAREQDEAEIARCFLQGLKPNRNGILLSDLKVRPPNAGRKAAPSHRSQESASGFGMTSCGTVG